MMMMQTTMRSVAALAALTLALPAQQDQDTTQLAAFGAKAREIAQAHVAGVVTVKVVIKIEFMGRSEEKRLESRGMLVSDTGLVITDAGVVDPNVTVNANGHQVDDVSASAEDIKVVFGNEEEEQDAFLVGKDSKLGFAFLQVRDFDATKRSIPIPDFDHARDPQVGAVYVTPNRLAKGFDYAPFFSFGWITGEVRKPRKGFLLSSGTYNGLPAYDLDGNLIGAHAQMQASVGQGSQAVLLKGPVVAAAIDQAKKRATQMLEEQGDRGEPAEASSHGDGGADTGK